MGTLRIYTALHKQQPEMIDACKRWLKSECKACIKFTRGNDFVKLYSIEGEGIPKGEEEFKLTVKILVPNVFMITVE